MNHGFVADASVGIAWVVESQSSPSTDQLLSEVESGAGLVVPILWTFELANALLVLLWRKRITRDRCSWASGMLSQLSPTVDEEGPRLALNKISELAEQHSLSVYDAAYLELAIRSRLPLASRDGALNKAAKLSGVRTLL